MLLGSGCVLDWHKAYDAGVDANGESPDGGTHDERVHADVGPTGDGALSDARSGSDAQLDGSDSDSSTDAGRTGPNIMFVTAETFTGNLGGLSGANAKCAEAAAAAHLPGHYVAVLATRSSPLPRSFLGRAPTS